MSHATSASEATASRPRAELAGARLSFARLVRGEWVKIRSLRATWWCWALIVAITIGLAALVALNVGAVGPDGPVAFTGRGAEQIVVLTGTVGVVFAQLIAAVLGVLNIAGEYTTGMIRSTFTAAPGRFGAIFAKATVLAVTTFIVSAVAIWGSILVAWPLLSHNLVEVDLGEPRVFLPLLGASVYVTLTTLLAFAFGLLLRSAAGGIATAMGLLLIAPIIALIVYSFTQEAVWMYDVLNVLPSNAGGHLYTYTGQPGPSGMNFVPEPPRAHVTQQDGGYTEGAIKAGVLQLDGWGGFAVLLGWVVVVGGIATLAAKRRDT